MSGKQIRSLPQTDAEWLALAHDSAWQVKSMALRVGYSCAHFRRVFQARFGVNPEYWLGWNRMVLARQWLREIGSVKETAWRLKYKHVSHFSMAFKQCYGITLSQFLRSYRHFSE